MECKITGDFVGFFDPKGNKMVTAGKVKIYDRSGIKILHIAKVTEIDAGKYSCNGSDSSDTVPLIIPGNFIFSVVLSSIMK